MREKNILALRLERQFLTKKANKEEYKKLYRDISPVQNIYFNGFGEPPCIMYRTDFDDIDFNRKRQRERELVKGRFFGGNVGFVAYEEFEIFIGLYKKEIPKFDYMQKEIYELLEHDGAMNIAQIKEITKYLVKKITPVLHKLQEAFMIFEDQFDGEWDRGWYLINDMFPELNINKYTRHEALKIVLPRFAYRLVSFNSKMAKSFYKLPEKEIKAALDELEKENILVMENYDYFLTDDYELINKNNYEIPNRIYILNRNDFLVKVYDYILKEKYKQEEFDVLQYILIDGKFCGAVVGGFKFGPSVLEDVVLDLTSDIKSRRKDEIIEAIYRFHDRTACPLKKFDGKPYLLFC